MNFFNDNNKRITFIIGSMRRGGAERVISILANEYADINWEVDILTLLDDSNDYELNEKIKVKYIGKKNRVKLLQLPFWIINIRRHIKQSKTDVIVSFIARINLITIIAKLGLNKKLVISERNDPQTDGRSKLIKFSTFILYPLADRVIFQTRWAQSCFPQRIQKKSDIIPNPINLNMQESKETNKLIVSVGRLEEQKNHELLIRSFSDIHKMYPDYKLVIYGEGSLRLYLTELIGSLGLKEAVLLAGNIENVHESMSKAEIFVLSSNYEGLSNALLEAMSIGLPCISTNCAGSNEIITNKENGIIVPIKDQKNLTNAINFLIANEELRRNIAEKAKTSTIRFKKEVVFQKWKEIL